MTDQMLRQLLLDTDAASPLPAMSRDLATTVRHRLRRRRTVQITAASTFLAAALALLPLLRTTHNRAIAIDHSKAQAELSLIRLQASSQAATVTRLTSYQRTLTLRT